MADTSQGEGWWQASDLKWYPPELHADAEHRGRHDGAGTSTEPPSGPPVAPTQPPAAPVAPTQAPAAPVAPTQPPVAPVRTPAASSPTPTAPPADGVPMPPPGVAPGPRFEPIPPPHDAPIPEPSPRRRSTQGSAEQGRRGMLFAGIGVALVGAVAAVVFLLAGDGDDAETPSADPITNSTEQTATPTPRQGALPGIDVTTSAAGTVDDPAAFGETYGWPEWRGTVIEVLDAVEEGLVAEFDDPPPPGNSHVAVIYEASYVGGDLSAFEPFIIDAATTDVVERFACILDTAALDAIGVSTGIFELVPGQTVRLAVCLEVATDAVDGMLVSLDNVNVFDDPIVFGPGGALLEPLDPPPLDGSERSFDVVPYGTLLEDDGWQGTVVDVFDATEAGIVSEFAVEPRAGSVYLAVVYDVTNGSDDDADFIPIRVTGIGSGVFEGFNSCFLDAEASAERNIEINRFELASGESVRTAACLEVPADEASTFVVRMQNSFAATGVFLLFPGDG